MGALFVCWCAARLAAPLSVGGHVQRRCSMFALSSPPSHQHENGPRAEEQRGTRGRRATIQLKERQRCGGGALEIYGTAMVEAKGGMLAGRRFGAHRQPRRCRLPRARCCARRRTCSLRSAAGEGGGGGGSGAPAPIRSVLVTAGNSRVHGIQRARGRPPLATVFGVR